MTVVYLYRQGQQEVEVARSTGGLAAVRVPHIGEQLTFVTHDARTLVGDVTGVHWVISDTDMKAVVRFG